MCWICQKDLYLCGVEMVQPLKTFVMTDLPITIETALSTLILVNKESKSWQNCEVIVKTWIETENLNAFPNIEEDELEMLINLEFDSLLMEFDRDINNIKEY